MVGFYQYNVTCTRMSMLDLSLISLYRINGQEWPLLPGLLAVNPPRKPARGREQDRLLVYLTLAGNVMYSSAEYAQITAQVSERFYATSGSLTFALKTAVESLNNYLVERNMGTSARKEYGLGALVLAALRGNSFYIVQSGPTHVYWLTGGKTHHFHDASLAGKGLGLSQLARMYFAQATINSGNRLLFCAALPPNWDKSLTEDAAAASPEFMRRRLLAITDTNVSAVLIQAVDGNGAMNILNPSKEPVVEAEPPAPKPQPTTAPVAPSPAPVTSAPPSSVQAQKASTPVPNQGMAVPENPVRPGISTQQPTPAAVRRAPLTAAVAPAQPAGKPQPPPVVERKPVPAEPVAAAEPRRLLKPEQREQLDKGVRAAARMLAQSIKSGRALAQKAGQAVEKMIPRLVPSEEEAGGSRFSGSWLAITALIIPAVVLTMAFVVYNDYGIPELHDSAFKNAKNEANKTINEQDPTALRTHWKAVLDFLTEADQYNPTDEASKTLRSQAQSSLDSLDRIVRVDYQPAFSTPLDSSLRVTRMAASDIDLYLLNDANGSVIRGTSSGTGGSVNRLNYSPDPTFECQPGSYNGIAVSPLIDMFALPRSNASGAAVIGIDASGDLLYCPVGGVPKAATLKPPSVGWNQITAIAYDSGNLYVLDAAARAVWVYVGTPDIQFPDPPYFFFGSQVPAHLEQTTGMAINGADLYLLYHDDQQNVQQSAHLTTCTLSQIEASPTRCTDPATLVDTRPGYQSGSTLPDVVFSQIAFASAPDPAVALLEPYTQSIFRFSARALELQNQIQPMPGQDNPLPKGALITAMAFSPTKVLFVFVGGQVYFAVNIP